MADIAIASNFIVYQYMGFALDAGRYPKLSRYLREIAALDAYRGRSPTRSRSSRRWGWIAASWTVEWTSDSSGPRASPRARDS